MVTQEISSDLRNEAQKFGSICHDRTVGIKHLSKLINILRNSRMPFGLQNTIQSALQQVCSQRGQQDSPQAIGQKSIRSKFQMGAWWQMSETSHLNIINIQVLAEDQMAIDKANGSYDHNIAENPTYYFWMGDHQTIPLGMNGRPEQFVSQIANALPMVNCLRVGFNRNSFNGDGSLNEDFERFLNAAAKKGFQLILVLADGDAQGTKGSPAEVQEALQGPIFAGMEAAWVSMMEWMRQHPDVKQAVYGWELVNEPASYANGIENMRTATAIQKADFVGLYVDQMKALGDIVQAESSAKVLVDLFGYAGQSEILAEKILDGRSAIDLFRERFSGDLVWSAHFYAGWRGTQSANLPGQTIAELQKLIDPLHDDDIIITETNARGSDVFNPYGSSVVTATALAFDWLADNGVAIGWFPGVQTGASNLATIWGNGAIRYLHQASLAAAFNAFSYGDADNEQSNIRFDGVTRLVAARLRNETSDPDYDNGTFDTVGFTGFAFGAGDADLLTGSDRANNFLYGGGGADTILGAEHDDFLFGQAGDDDLRGGSGINFCFGGSDQDTLRGEGELSRFYGGSGADLFMVSSANKVEIADLNVRNGDRWTAPNSSVITKIQNIDLNHDGKNEQIVTFSGGQTVVLFIESIGMISNVLRSGPNTTTFPVGLVRGSEEYGSATADVITVGDGETTLFGGAADDTLVGGEQSDSLYGGEDEDFLTAYGGSDELFAGKGRDSVDGGTGADFIAGGIGADSLTGGVGYDRLFGGKGADLICGGAGNDLLIGGRGPDVFVFAAGDGRDVLRSFDWDIDKLQFAGINKSEIEVTAVNGNCLITYDGGRIVLFNFEQVDRLVDSLEFT